MKNGFALRPLCAALLVSFLLGIHDGRIALWKDDDPEPVRVFPYYANALPPSDRAALEKGILIEGESNLNRLLEDFLS